jgi:hypothetical protein
MQLTVPNDSTARAQTRRDAVRKNQLRAGNVDHRDGRALRRWSVGMMIMVGIATVLTLGRPRGPGDSQMRMLGLCPPTEEA